MRRLLDIARLRLRSLARRGRVEHELDKELRFHLDQQTEENIAAGMSPDEARRAALHMLDGVIPIEEECRDMRRTDFMENFLQDLRYAARMLAKSPGFAITIVLTLALSIGANSAIFSVIDGVLLKKLPYPQQDRIVRFFLSSHTFPKFPINPWDFLDFRARNRAFGSMAIMTHNDVQLSGAGETQRLVSFQVSAGYFRVLGIPPARGRDFTTRDELPGNGRSAILSDRLWRTHFGADPAILGRKIRIEGLPFTVVGVMPPSMEHPGNLYKPVPYGDTVDLWTPFTFEGNPNQRGSHYIEGIGRLKDGFSVAQAGADMNARMVQLAREHGDGGWRVLVIPLYTEVVGASQKLLLVLLGAVGLVLLIACANAANLLLARAMARQREIAVRSALGASRGRLIRQMLTESALISLAGGVAGALLAIGGVKALVALLPAGFPRAHEIHVNAAVFAFTLGIALATGFLFGMAPALQTSRTDVQQNLREGGRGMTGSARQMGLRNWLVVAEVSLASVLLIGAGLMLRSFINLLESDPGFRPEHVLTAAISLPYETYKNEAAKISFYDRLVHELSNLPGVTAAGVGTDVPWSGYDDNTGGWRIEGKTPPPNEDFHARYHAATADYFRAVGIPLLAGRFFEDTDVKKSRSVLIINHALAELYWRGENPVGKRVCFCDDHPKDSDWTTIVGVVGDVKDTPEKAAAEPALWWAADQVMFFGDMRVVVRTNGDPLLLGTALQRAVRDLDPSIAVSEIRTLDQIADAGVSTPRFALFLVGMFAALAITLAGIGAYGVISWSVSQRTHEFGMRVALGAKPGDVLRLVLGQGIRLAVLGVAIGLIGALALARVLRSLLFEVSAADPLTFALVSVMALAIAALACYLPAWKATKADPMVALRAE